MQIQKENTPIDNQPRKQPFAHPLRFVNDYPLFQRCQPKGILYDIRIIAENKVKSLSKAVKYEILVERNYVPCGFKFPRNDTDRHLNPSFLHKYSWLRYSVEFDKVFCAECVLFGGDDVISALATVGYNDWSNVSKICQKHCSPNSAKKEIHLNCVQKAADYPSFSRGKSGIMEQLK